MSRNTNLEFVYIMVWSDNKLMETQLNSYVIHTYIHTYFTNTRQHCEAIQLQLSSTQLAMQCIKSNKTLHIHVVIIRLTLFCISTTPLKIKKSQLQLTTVTHIQTHAKTHYIPYCLKLWPKRLFFSSKFSSRPLNKTGDYTRPVFIS